MVKRVKKAVRVELDDNPVFVYLGDDGSMRGFLESEPDREVIIEVSLVQAMNLRDKLQNFINEAIGPPETD